MQLSNDTLELAAVAMRSSINKLSRHVEGTVGYNLRTRYSAALAEITGVLAADTNKGDAK